MKQYEELFINGSRVNIGDTNITLEWKSVIFSDISKYVASHSYTVKLPMTQHNRRIFASMETMEKAEAEDTRAVVGKRMSARYYCNGVDLLGDANAYLMGTDGENYKITLTWNAVTGFKEMSEEERKIPEVLSTDLNGNEVMHTVPYEDYYNSIIDPNLHDNVLALDYYNGVPPVRYIGTLPSFKVTWIIARLLDHYGIPHSLNTMIATEDDDDLLNSLYCPMTTLNDTEKGQYYSVFREDFGATCADDGHVRILGSGMRTLNSFSPVYSSPFFNPRVTGAYDGDYSQYFCGWIGKHELMKYKVKPHIRLFVCEEDVELNTRVRTTEWMEAFLLQNLTLELMNGTGTEDVTSVLSLKPTFVSGEWRRPVDATHSVTYFEVRFENDEEESESNDGLEIGDITGIKSVDALKSLRRIRRFMLKGVSRAFFYYKPAFDIEKATLTSMRTGTYPQAYDNYATVTPVFTEGSYIEPYSNEKLVGHELSLEPNMPDMKPMDFIKGVLRLTGMFPYMKDGELCFARYGKLIDNMPYAPDWSDFVTGNPVLPKSISLSVSNFNRRNWMRYKDDDEDNPKYSGYFDVADESLNDEDDLFTLPFASHGQMDDGRALVPVFENGTVQTSYSLPTGWMLIRFQILNIYRNCVEDVAGFVFKEAKPHIGRRVKSSYWSMPLTTENLFTKNLDKLSFEGLSFADPDSIVRQRYRVFEEILKTPYIIKVTMDIDEVTLRDLNFTVPVFLRQYSSYFGVISIKRKSEGECTVELVRIPNSLLNN